MKKVLILFINLLILNTLIAQTILDELREKDLRNQEEVSNFLRQTGLNKKGTTVEGETWELVKIIDGKPLYYITNNANAAATLSTDEVYSGGNAGLSLSGSTVFIGEWDGGGVLTTHQELTGRVISGDSPGSTNYHSTHVAGTLIASGVEAAAKGMAYAAELHAYEWNSDDSEMASEAANDLLVSNHSYGSISGWATGSWSGTNGPHWWGAAGDVEDYKFGRYDSGAQTWDDIAYNYPDYLIFKSAGNDRNDYAPSTGTTYYRFDASWNWITDTYGTGDPNDDGYDNGGYDTIPNKGNAKNIMTVGSVGDIPAGYSQPSDVVMESYSGWGPADDGRIKPDVVANGSSLYSSFDDNNSAYNSISGTSMACPNAAGSAILLQEHYQNLNSGNSMKAATLKALIIHTADEAGIHQGPDYKFGWGLINTEKAANLITTDNSSTKIFEATTYDSRDTYNLTITSAGTEPLKATICWTDPEGTPPSSYVDQTDKMLVNDLDLRITKDTDTYYPWTLDPSNPDAAAVQNSDNITDNVEQVFIDSPESGSYTISVTNKGLAGNSQDFSLILSGGTLGAPDITYNLTNVDVTMEPNQTYSENLIIGNNGDGWLNYEASIAFSTRTELAFNEINEPKTKNHNLQERTLAINPKPQDSSTAKPSSTNRTETRINYCSDNHESSLGWTDGGTMEIAARFTSDELSPYYNTHSITKVDLRVGSTYNTINLKIWKGGSNSDPGTEIFSSDITTQLTAGSWNTIALATPLSLESGNEYWVGYSAAHDSGEYPCAYDDIAEVADKGAKIYNGGAWNNLSDYGYDHNFMIKMVVEGNWLTFNGNSSISGQIAVGGEDDTLSLDFDTSDLALGDYTASINIITNDPEEPSVQIPVSLTVDEVLTSPTNIEITTSGNDVILTWDPVSGATNYKIYHSTESDSGFVFLEDAGNSTTYTHTDGALSERKGFYRVTAE